MWQTRGNFTKEVWHLNDTSYERTTCTFHTRLHALIAMGPASVVFRTKVLFDETLKVLSMVPWKTQTF